MEQATIARSLVQFHHDDVSRATVRWFLAVQRRFARADAFPRRPLPGSADVAADEPVAVAKLGPLTIPIPEWLTLGHATIVEEALDDTHFAMDFRLTHPLFGQLFRYSGTFEAATR